MKWTTEHINRIAQKVIANGGEYRTMTYCYYIAQWVTGRAYHLMRITNALDGPADDMGATTIFNQPKRG